MRARSPLLVVFLTIFLDLLGFGLIIPIVTYYAQQFHASEGQIGLLGTLYSLAQFVFVPFWGRLSDRIGRRPVILVSVFGSMVAFGIFGAARSLLWLYAARVVAGGMTANISTVQAYIADTTTAENRAKGMGLIGAAFGLGFVLGPFLGGELAAVGRATGIGLGLVGYGAAALSALNLVLAFFLLPESLKRGATAQHDAVPTRLGALAQLRATFSIEGLLAVLVVAFIVAFAAANMEWTFTLLTEHRLGWDKLRGPALNGRVFGLVGVISAVVQGGLIGRITRALGEKRMLAAGAAILAAGLGGLALVHTVPVLLAASALIAVGNSLVGPSLSSLASRMAPADRQGEVLGGMQSMSALGRVAGPASGGFLFQLAGVPVPFIVAGVSTLVACAVTVLGIRPVAKPGT